MWWSSQHFSLKYLWRHLGELWTDTWICECIHNMHCLKADIQFQVLRSAKFLHTKDRYRSFYVCPDSSIVERRAYKQFIEELKKRISEPKKLIHWRTIRLLILRETVGQHRLAKLKFVYVTAHPPHLYVNFCLNWGRVVAHMEFQCTTVFGLPLKLTIGSNILS